jgi:hypothetical protein
MASNLFSNLLVAGILGSLVIIIYCKVKNRTLLETWQELTEIIFGGVDEQGY